jgi:hypothetical protein
MHACLEVIARHRGLLDRMLPAPLRPLDDETARRIVAIVEAVGVQPDMVASAV